MIKSKVSSGGKGLVAIEGVSVGYATRFFSDDAQSFVLRAVKRQKEKEIFFWALKNINCAIGEKDIIGIVGDNGAGKTTLCRIIAGALRPDVGEIIIKNNPSVFLLTGAGFDENISGRDNIFLSAFILGVSKKQIAKLLSKIISFSGLGETIHRQVSTYSLGMKSRLGFSIATTLEPDILIIDEVLGVGDFGFKEKASKKIQEIIKKVKAIVIATHRLDFIKSYCTKAVYLQQGRILYQGDPDEAVERYKRDSGKNSASKIKKNFATGKDLSSDPDAIIAENITFNFPLKGDFSLEGRGKSVEKENPCKALRGISFKVKQGDVFGIIGNNGAGKTTLCRILSRALFPEEGNLLIAGKLTAVTSLGLGFNFQLDGKDNIYLNGLMIGIRKNRLNNIYHKICDFSELGDSINKPIKTYSSGMRSRLSFSVVSSVEPDILIIDEVLGVGDFGFKEKASKKIQEIITKAKAVIVSTHDLNFVRNVCTKALWLERGEVKFCGEAQETVERYLAEKKS